MARMRQNAVHGEDVASTFSTTEGNMRLIKLLVVLLIGLVGIGLYRGWFSLSHSNPEPEGNKVNVTVSVDKGKIKADVKKVKEEIKEEVKELEGKGHAKEAK
jgi:hypothetical protein